MNNKIVFKSQSERSVADYITTLGLTYVYEELRGVKRPDFTVYDGKRIVAVIEVEDFALSKEELVQLKSGKIVESSFDPYEKIREKINTARKQFRGSEEYPCILVLSRNHSHVFLDPMIVYGAMLGDITISIPLDVTTGGGDMSQATTGFGLRGKMLRPNSLEAQNTAITSIAVLSDVFPDKERAEVDKKLKELLVGVKFEDKDSQVKYLQEAKELEQKLRDDGYKLDWSETSLIYMNNPLASKAFPDLLFKGKYDVFYTYFLDTGEIRKK